jgi:predicted O-methyltransferase YrrM
VNIFFYAIQYLSYRFRSGNAHDIHSPFVFDLFNNVINDHTPYYGFDLIESVRDGLLISNEKINLVDFGTGRNNRRSSIRTIAKTSVKPKKYAQLLFRLINRFAAEHILEIGTSLGITTLYLSLPDKKNQVITLEGSLMTAEIAIKIFNRLKRSNIELLCGEFDETLPLAIQKLKRLDFIYFDGNHRKESTLSYFNKCKQFKTEESIFVFDDIHWSRSMHSAWEEIKNDKDVTISIDLFQLGIVFFRKGLPKQHFILKF